MRRIIRPLGVVVMAALLVMSLVGCNMVQQILNPGGTNPGGNDPGTTNPGVTNVGGKLTVNLDGAKALITKSSTTSSQAMAKGFKPRAITDSPLAKIMEDGSLSNVLQTDGTLTIPDIDFIAVSPLGDVFVYFKWQFTIPSTTGSQIQMQFIKLTSDNKIEIVESSANIQKFNWNWGGASANQKPIVFADDGSIFYAAWGNDGTELKRYAGGVATRLTVSGSNVNIQAFFCDGTNLYFVGQNNTADNTAWFLRMVRPDGSTKDVLYKNPGTNLWIRAVKRRGSEIYLHGYGMPGPVGSGKELTSYYGLIKLAKDAADVFTLSLVVGYSSETTNTGSNTSTYKLTVAYFDDDSGVLDRDLMNGIVRPFFTDGIVPDAIDFEKKITWDRTSDEFVTDFVNSDERYFWHLLLKDYAGYDPEYVLTKNVDQWGNRGNLFDQNISEALMNQFFNSTSVGATVIPDSETTLLNADGTVDETAFMARFKAGQNRNAVFKSIELKPGVEIPRELNTNSLDTEAKRQAFMKNFLDANFIYVPNDATVNYDSAYYSEYYQSAYYNYYRIRKVEALGYDSSTQTFDQDLFDLLVKDAVTYGGQYPSNLNEALFGRKTNPSSGKTFNPATDLFTNDEYYNLIEWDFEASDPSLCTVTGVLGKYRVKETRNDSRCFYSNFYNGIPKVTIQLSQSGTSGSVSNVFSYSSITGLYSFMVIPKSKTTSDALISYLKGYTNATNLTLKVFSNGKSIFSERNTAALNGTEVSNDVEYRFDLAPYYEGATYAYDEATGYYWYKSSFCTDAWYHTLPTQSNLGWACFLNNFFSDVTTPIDYPWNNYGYLNSNNFVESVSWTEYKANSSRGTVDISTVDLFTADVATRINALSVVPKNLGGGTFTPGCVVSDTQEFWYYPIAWEVEENDPTKTYDKTGIYGKYRFLNTTYTNGAWVKNLFTATPKQVDLTTADGTNGTLGNLLSYIQNDSWYDSVTQTNKTSPLYSGWINYTKYEWKPAFKNGDGTLNDEAVLSGLSDYSASPSIAIPSADGYSERAYCVYLSDGVTVDYAATRAALISAVFSLPDLVTYPTVLWQGVWQYAGNTGMSTGVDFNNLENFSFDSTGQIYGLFRVSWDSANYNLYKLMDSTGTAVQVLVRANFPATALKIQEGSLFFLYGTGNVQAIKMLDLTSNVETTLVPESANIEMFKYNVAMIAQRVYFTGREVTQNVLKVGSVSLATNQVTYQSTSGITATSEVEIFSGN